MCIRVVSIVSVVDCGGLDSPENGTVDLSEGTTFGSTAFYSCDEIFELDGNSTRVCLSSGVWSDEPPNCYSEYHLFTYTDCIVIFVCVNLTFRHTCVCRMLLTCSIKKKPLV